MNNHGGKRPGAGRPFGCKTKKTLAKEAAQELVRQQITAQLEPLITRQISDAIGASSVFVQDAVTGRWRLVADEDEIDPAEHPAGRYLRVFTKDPNSQALAQLLDRALDKPRRPEQEVKVQGEVEVVRRLAAGRVRGHVV